MMKNMTWTPNTFSHVTSSKSTGLRVIGRLKSWLTQLVWNFGQMNSSSVKYEIVFPIWQYTFTTVFGTWQTLCKYWPLVSSLELFKFGGSYLFLKEETEKADSRLLFAAGWFDPRMNKWKERKREGRERWGYSCHGRKQVESWRLILKCPADVQQSKRKPLWVL